MTELDALIEGLVDTGWCPNSISGDPARQAYSVQCNSGKCVPCSDTLEQRRSCWKKFAELYATDQDFRKHWRNGDREVGDEQ